MAYESAIAIIGVGGLFGLLILAVNTDGEIHPGPKLFYILMSLWYIVGLIALSQQIALGDTAPTAVNNIITSLYRAMIVTAILMTFYYVIYFIKSLMEWITGIWSNKRNKKNMGV